MHIIFSMLYCVVDVMNIIFDSADYVGNSVHFYCNHHYIASDGGDTFIDSNKGMASTLLKQARF